MTTHDDDSTVALLHDLDAADTELTSSQRARAATTLEQILMTDPETATKVVPPHASRRRRLLLTAGGVATAAAAAVVVVPVVTGGGQAFASWSATPIELRGPARSAALDACVKLQSGDEAELALGPDAPARALIAEARGGWNYVIFEATGPTGRRLQGSCLMPDSVVADPRPGEGGFFGGLGGAKEIGGPPRRTVVREDVSGEGSVDGELFVYAEGRAGADVAGIEVTTPSGQQVEASVDNGWWAVWWPAGDDSMQNPDITQAPTYEVTLRDGTVREGLHTPR